jgi:hypothetical protein
MGMAHRGAGALWRRVAALGPVKGPLAVSAAVAALGAAVYFGGPWLAAAWGCVVGLVATQVAKARETLRRLLSAHFAGD